MYKLKKIRDEKKLTQEKLAEKSDVSKQTIGDIERSDHDTTIQTMIRLCLALEVTPNELIGWEDIVKNEKGRNEGNLDS